MLNYLWVINPVHKNSIRSIHLEISVPFRNFSPPKKAFVMLAELQGLQDLHLEFNINPYLCRRVNHYHHVIPYPTIHNDRYVPSSELTRIRCCKELRQIQVQSLVLEFVIEEWMRNRSNIHVPGKTELSAVGNGPYYDLKEELKEAMVARKGSMRTA